LNHRWNIDPTTGFRQSHFRKKEDDMKRKLPAYVTLTLLVALTLPALVVAQQAPRYRLVDLGTFGGPASYFANGYDGILNNHGTAVGAANTTEQDPFCFWAPNCFGTHAFQAQNGVVTDLGVLPGGDSSTATWISANGLIAGFSQNGEFDPLLGGFPEIRAALWRNGEMTDLGTLGGGFESLANAANNRGQVVGFALNTVPDPCSLIVATQTRAFLWQNGTMQDLGTLGGPDANAEQVNDAGQIAGSSSTNSIDPATGCPFVHPFFWQNGTMLDMGTLGGTGFEIRALNERGEVVGLSNLSGDQTFHPFLWSKGQLTDLGTLGGDNGEPNWINNRGDIVGKADLPGPAPQLHDAVLWKHGQVVDLGVLPGDSCSNAYFVNSHGQVVGTSENQYLCSIFVGQHAFLWEKGGPMVNLNTLVPFGASLDLTYAVAINNRGEIAGFGVPPDCAPEDYELCGHAYMLIPCGVGEECVNTTAFNSTPSAIPSVLNASPARPQTDPANPLERFREQMRQRPHLRGSGEFRPIR
jgi:probable HAF family extracellular repeat protein